MLKKIIRPLHSKKDKEGIIVLDTEGLGNPASHIGADSKIFLFALLLSSLFLFNTVSAIDEMSFQDLQVMLNLAKDIQAKNNGENDFPSFFWIVRDFIL